MGNGEPNPRRRNNGMEKEREGQTWPEWTHLVVDRKPAKGPDLKWSKAVELRAGLHYLRGLSAPYFSVTVAYYDKRGKDVGGGPNMETVRKYWPVLYGPVTDLHWSDHNGRPMHVAENGLYFLGFGRYTYANGERYGNDSSPDEVTARHFRITIEEVKWLRDHIRGPEWKETAAGWHGLTHNREKYAQWIALQEGRWKREADEGVALLDQLKEQKSWEREARKNG
jgi:hypothetical protein